jgi:hypothetical protein
LPFSAKKISSYHDNNLKIPANTTGTNGFTNSASSATITITQSALDQLVESKVKELLQAKHSSHQRNSSGGQQSKQKSYCWTHGSCLHSSSNCKNPAEGHQPNATFKHRMNGSAVASSLNKKISASTAI